MPVVLARGFRPFFLLAGIEALVGVPFWVAVLAGLVPAPAWLDPAVWHAHEMLFGFACAAMAGFLLTSVPVWTGSPPVIGARLAALAALWLAGRISFACAGALPRVLVAALDLAFLPALAVAVGVPLLRARERRNQGFPLVLLALFGANLAVHLDACGLAPGAARGGLRLAVFGIALLVAVIGGRIIPSFTRNALRRAGLPGEPRSWPVVEGLAIPSVILVALVDAVAPRTLESGSAALLVAAVHGARLAGWETRRTLGDPLVWSLHAGYAWLPLGFAALAAGDLAGMLPFTSAVHALTAGAFGGMILAVMTRVALGHTGRALAAPRGIPQAYALSAAGAAVRVLGPLALPADPLVIHVLAGALWSAAFALFLFIYAPMLCHRRIDEASG
jgi:uncharacterized protein involved in response to NO